MGFKFFKRSSKTPKVSPASKERKAIDDMDRQARIVSDKAIDDYLAGRITKQQRDRRLERASRIKRGF